SGSGLDTELPTADLAGFQPVPGAVLRSMAEYKEFGFMTLDRRADGWLLTEHDVDGKALLTCEIKNDAPAALPCKLGAAPGSARIRLGAQ
ncbi:MAG: hypothetical protein MO847_02925, partial [Candidatus Protistobacter heckmanni]|nr:hypothetical protein [Candidatus Protistobacter heckmanni]